MIKFYHHDIITLTIHVDKSRRSIIDIKVILIAGLTMRTVTVTTIVIISETHHASNHFSVEEYSLIGIISPILIKNLKFIKPSLIFQNISQFPFHLTRPYDYGQLSGKSFHPWKMPRKSKKNQKKDEISAAAGVDSPGKNSKKEEIIQESLTSPRKNSKKDEIIQEFPIKNSKNEEIFLESETGENNSIECDGACEVNLSRNNQGPTKSPLKRKRGPKSIGGNKNAVIVLDIDETFCHAYTDVDDPEIIDIFSRSGDDGYDPDRFKTINFIGIDGEPTTFKIVYRPGAKEIVEYLQNNFKMVVVWTASVENYAKAVLKNVFGDDLPILLTRNDCYVNDDVNTKPLRALCDKLEIYLKNMIIIDDADYSTSFNTKNRIKIPAYFPETGRDDEDDALYKIIAFFESKEFYLSKYPSEVNYGLIKW